MTTSRPRKTILITDAGSAIGEAIARHLASQGHQMMLGGPRLDRIAALARDIVQAGGTASFQEMDVTSRGSLRAFLLIAEACHGRIDALVNTAGMTPAMVAVLPVLKAQGVDHVIHVPTDHALQPRAIAEQVEQAIDVYGGQVVLLPENAGATIGRAG
jgi:NADP-dependent 3-hydroxy acid dehydrogenase YdfG